MAKPDSTEMERSRNEALDKLVGFDVSGVASRVDAALVKETRSVRRTALKEVRERLRNLSRTQGPEHLETVELLDAISRAMDALRPLMFAAASRVPGAERRDGARRHVDEVCESATLRAIVNRSFEMIELMTAAKQRTITSFGASLPPIDARAGRPKLAFLGGLELLLRQARFTDREIDALVLRSVADNRKATAETRKAAFDAITKRIKRAREAQDATAAQERQVLEDWLRDPGNRKAFEALGSPERQNAI